MAAIPYFDELGPAINEEWEGEPKESENWKGSTRSVQSLLERGQLLHDKLCKWAGPGSARLQKLVRAELSFLNRLDAVTSDFPATSSCRALLRSSNFDHLEDVFEILQNPLVYGVSAVMKEFNIGGPPYTSAGFGKLGLKESSHVDIACVLEGKPVWLIVFSRNRRYIRWLDGGSHDKGLRNRLRVLLRAARADIVTRPTSVFLCFSGPGDIRPDVDQGMKAEFNAIHLASSSDGRPSLPGNVQEFGNSNVFPERLKSSRPECGFLEVEGGEWLDIQVKWKPDDGARLNQHWETYQVDVQSFEQRTVNEHFVQGRTEIGNTSEPVKRTDDAGPKVENCPTSSSSMLYSGAVSDSPIRFKTSVKPSLRHLAVDGGQKLVNMDTTSLVAMVSEISNGGAGKLLDLPSGELEKRFPSMVGFLREQARSELERPLLSEIEQILACRQPIVSKYVFDEFTSIVSKVGGAKEKERAMTLLQRVCLVPDTPSDRVMSLLQSGTIKRRHKIVFGTGDSFLAPTLTANLAFVRAATEKGLSIAILEHRPRALTGE